MTILTNTGELVSGSPETIVSYLRVTAHTPTATDATYMADVAHRLQLWDGSEVDTAAAARFLRALAACDVILVEE